MKTENNYTIGKAHKDLVYSIKGSKLNDNKIYILRQKETNNGLFGFLKKKIKIMVTELRPTKPKYKNNVWDHKGLF